MTSPNVGKVTLGVDIESDDLWSKVTRDVREQVMPALEGLNKKLGGVSAEIEKINKKTTAGLAKEIGAVKKQSDSTAAAIRQVGNEKRRLDKLDERIRKAELKRDADYNKARRKNATDADRNRLTSSRNALALLRNDRKALTAVILESEAKVRAKREEDHQRYLNLIENARAAQIAAQRAVGVELQRQIREHFRQAEADSKVFIDGAWRENKERNAAHAALLKSWLDAEAKYTRDLEREEAARTKATEREEVKRTRASEREAKRRARQAERDALRAARDVARRATSFENIANFGKNLGGVGKVAMIGGVIEAAKAIADLAAVAASASQVIYALPAAFAGAAAAMGVFKLATEGVSDALEALWSIDADPEKYFEALDKLAPSAQKAMEAIRGILPELKALGKGAQDTMFAGSDGWINKLWENFKPTIDKLTQGLSGSMNRMLGSLVDALTSGDTPNQIGRFVDNLVAAFQMLEPIIPSVVKSIGILLDKGSTSFPILADAIAGALTSFTDFLDKASRDGSLERWIENGIETFKTLSGIVVYLVQKFMELAPVGEKILPDVERVMKLIVDVASELIEYLATSSGHMEGWVAVLEIVNTALKGLNSPVGELVSGLLKVLNPLFLIAETVEAIKGLWDSITGNTPDMATAARAQMDKAVRQAKLDVLLGKRDAPTPDTTIGQVFPTPASIGDIPLPPGIAPPPGAAPAIPSGLSPDMAALFPSPVPNVLGGRTPEQAQADLDAGRVVPPDRNAVIAAHDAEEESKKKPTDSDIKKQIQEAFPIDQFMVDPYAPIGGVQNLPGMPGRTPLKVTVDNLPKGGLPGTTGLPGLPSALPSGGTGSPADIAKLIFSMATQRGYTAHDAQAIVAYAIGESSLDPKSDGGTQPAPGSSGNAYQDGVIGLFQQKPAFAAAGGIDPAMRADPVSNITAYLNNLAKNSGMPIEQALPATSQGGPLATGADWNSLMQQAANYLGATGGAVPGGMPTAASSTGGLMPATANLEQVVRQVFPMITDIGGVRQDPHPDHPSGRAIDIMIPGGTTRGGANPQGKMLGDQIWQWLMSTGIVDSNGSLWQTDTGGDHFNHIHARIKEGMENAMLQGVAASFSDNMYAQNGPMMVDPTTGQQGYFQVDQQAVLEADNALQRQAFDLAQAQRDLAVTAAELRAGLADQTDLIEAQNKVREEETGLTKAQMDLAEKQRGTFKSAQPMDYSKLPYGDPRKIMAGVLGGLGVTNEDLGLILGGVGPALGGVGQVMGGVAGDIVGAASSVPIGQIATPTSPSTDLNQLIQERNPLALAQASGFNVPDYAEAGGGASAQNVMANGGPPGDPTGRIYSDTAALIDRTFTSLDASEKARHDQVMAVLNEVKERLGGDVLKPILEEGVAGGMEGMGDGVTADIGAAMGTAAGPPIAAAVQSAMPSSSGGGASTVVTTGVDAVVHGAGGGAAPGPSMFHSLGFDTGFHSLPSGFGPLGGLYDEGGLWPSGTFGTNLSGSPERVLSPSETKLFDAGLLGGWNLQPMQQHFATVSGVDVTDSVGGDFFGMSQVPILGALVNLLVMVLLRVIGVQIEARDTLNEISTQFRDFRGDFQAFDAQGRLLNDTSGLVDRTGSSEQAAADERVRILKLVLEGLIKFIIEKIIVPIGKAVANAAISIGSQMASSAISGGMGAAFPGGSVVGGAIGGVVSSAIQAGGSAAVDIIADVGAQLGEAALGVLIDGIGEILQGVFPDITNFFFGGNFIAAIADPITNVLTGLLGGVTTLLGGLVGGLADLWPFDEGGVAHGMGFMPKATIQPERVLSPQQTKSFDTLVDALTSGRIGVGNTKRVEIHAPFHVQGGGEAGARRVRNELLELMS